MTAESVFYWSLAVTALGLVLIGLWGVLTRKNILRIALAFTLADTGVNLILVWSGFLPGRSAPIVDSSLAASSMVDPLPQALVLTSIVIGVAVAALFVVVGVLASRKSGSADIRRMKELKW